MGALASYIWQNRDCFDSHCVTLLRARTTELAVQKAAIRTLVLTGNSERYDICDDLSARTEDPIRGFAALAPSLMPAGIDLDRYVKRLLDPANGHGMRAVTLVVLGVVGRGLRHFVQKSCRRGRDQRFRRSLGFSVLADGV